MTMFSEVVGHERLISYFERSISHQNISHAYLLTGEQGMGKMTLARAWAKALLCEQGTGCGVCHACRQFQTGNHPDVCYVQHEKPASIGVDEIREQLVADAEIRPYQGKYKIYIVDDAEKMTVQAQNALLKTMEEPPAYVMILLLATSEESMLQTILSRCITLKLRPLQDGQIRSWLMSQKNMERKAADVCTVYARGNLGKAITLAESETYLALYQEVVSLLKTVHQRGTYEILSVLKERKEEMADILDMISLWFRDVEIWKASEDASLLIFGKEQDVIAAQAKVYDYKKLDLIQTEIGRTRERLGANVGLELALEMLLLQLKPAR